MGRFASRDPFPGLPTRPATLHRYLYAEGDPVNRADPTGEFAGVIGLSVANIMVGVLSGIHSALRFLQMTLDKYIIGFDGAGDPQAGGNPRFYRIVEGIHGGDAVNGGSYRTTPRWPAST